MEDKKVMEFINKHHEEVLKQERKQIKSKIKKDKILNIFMTAMVIGLLFLFASIIRKDTMKYIDKCVAKGHTYNYCLRDAQ